MPAGLDGNPDPIRTPERDGVIATVADLVAGLPAGRRAIVAIDGIDGSGKSTFADELAAALAAHPHFDREVVRASVDSFHNPRSVRHARGPGSPTGFYRDSTDLVALTRELLDPFAAGSPFRVAVFDEPSDSPVDDPPVVAAPDAVLVFDGIFGHRRELLDRWDCSVFLDGWDRVTAGRVDRVVAACPGDPLGDLLTMVRWGLLMRRYVLGQRQYLDECAPAGAADVLIDNNDLAAPSVIRCGRTDTDTDTHAEV
jgi:uridine kinase